MSMATGQAQGLKGTGYKQVSMPTLAPQQMQLFQQLLGGAQQGLGGGLGNLSQMASGGSPEYWQQLEAPALRQFGQLQGDIASRFSGMGSGARRSSGFQNVLGGAASDLASNLQAQRLGLQQSALQQLLGLSSSLLGTPLSENLLVPEQTEEPFWKQLLRGIVPGASQGLGMLGGSYGMRKLGF